MRTRASWVNRLVLGGMVGAGMLATGCSSGLKGVVYDADAGTRVRAALILVPEDGGRVKHVHACSDGEFRVRLPQGKYQIQAIADGYQAYRSTEPFMVSGDGFDVADVRIVQK